MSMISEMDILINRSIKVVYCLSEIELFPLMISYSKDGKN